MLLFRRGQDRKQCDAYPVDKGNGADEAYGKCEFRKGRNIGLLGIQGLIGNKEDIAAVQQNPDNIHGCGNKQPAGGSPKVG